MHVVLTIAGSDPSGGAGLQANLKTFAAHRVFGASAITAVTVQNTLGVTKVVPLDPELVAAQIDAVVSDLGASAVKTGMLANAPIVETVAAAILRHRLVNVVVDPVIVSSSGRRLLDAAGVAALVDRLMPLATVVTPNVPEAEALTGLSLQSVGHLRDAARQLVSMGARAAIVTGGHLDGPAVDVLFDGHAFVELSADRLSSRHTHGTGCTFAAAVAAQLARGRSLEHAARAAKEYVRRAIDEAPGLGGGRGPLEHFPRGYTGQS